MPSHAAPYDRLAGDYDRRWAAYNERNLALLRPLLGDAPGDVLDLACGTANLLARLGPGVRRYVGVAVRREMLLAARPKLAAPPLPAALAAADSAALPFRDARFDTVV